MTEFNEMVATENAKTIMNERVIDLLTNNTRIKNYVNCIGEVTTDFTYGVIKVKTDMFTITYLVNATPYIEFETGCEFYSVHLSDFCDMLDCNEEVENIFHSVKEKYVYDEEE